MEKVLIRHENIQVLKAFRKEKTFTVRLLFSFEQIGRYECFEEKDKSKKTAAAKKVECFKYFYTYLLFFRKADNRLGSKITSTWSKSDSLSSAVDFKILQLLISKFAKFESSKYES